MSALKLKELTVIIASSLCLWSVDIASVNAAQFTFKNETNKIATDFHVKSKLVNGEIDELTIDFTDRRFPFRPIPHGESFTIEILNEFISAEWSFEKGENQPVEPYEPDVIAPEPTTIFGSALALGVGGWLKRKKSSRQNKTRSQH
jgi:hypothetical protein